MEIDDQSLLILVSDAVLTPVFPPKIDIAFNTSIQLLNKQMTYFACILHTNLMLYVQSHYVLVHNAIGHTTLDWYASLIDDLFYRLIRYHTSSLRNQTCLTIDYI